MTWVSHIAVGAATAKVFGLSIPLTTLGAIMPDMIEQFYPSKIEHRGITHSVILWILSLVALWITPVRDIMIGAVVGHILMDALTIMGVPLLGANSQRVTFLGGLIRTGSMAEYGVSFGIVALCLLLSGTGLSFSTRNWKGLLDSGIIDQKEYYEKRFKLL